MRRTSSSISSCVLAETSDAPGRNGPAPSRGSTASGPIASLMPQRPTIWRAICGQLLDVGLGAGVDLAEDDLLGGAAAERDLDLREQLVLARS